MDYLIAFITNQYKGRINRKTYIVGIALITLVAYLLNKPLNGTGIYALIFAIAFIYLGYGLLIRRLHDIGYSGWYSLIQWIPIIGFFFGIYVLVKTGQKKKNQYGNIPDGHKPILRQVFNLK